MWSPWTHLVRFLAKEDGRIHLGQVDSAKWPDVGLALEAGNTVTANLIEGTVFDGVVTDKSMTISYVGPCAGTRYRARWASLLTKV